MYALSMLKIFLPHCEKLIPTELIFILQKIFEKGGAQTLFQSLRENFSCSEIFQT